MTDLVQGWQTWYRGGRLSTGVADSVQVVDIVEGKKG